jgi:hypothetical protein
VTSIAPFAGAARRPRTAATECRQRQQDESGSDAKVAISSVHEFLAGDEKEGCILGTSAYS